MKCLGLCAAGCTQWNGKREDCYKHIWLYNKLTSNEIDDIISAELPNADVDKHLHETVTKNMIHGPCGTLNPNSPCLIDGKCSKQYPRAFVSNTVTGNDGYTLYRRSAEDGGRISLPHNFCNLVTSKEELVEKVFPNIQINYKNHDWLSERAVLAAKNKDFYELNNIIQSNIKSETVTYKSVDTVVEADEAVNYPTVFLNSLDLPGIPPHVLQLNISVPIIMLRNINQPKLCNGTLLAVKKLISNVIETTILTGPLKGEDVLIPRIPMIPTDMPFQFKRLQFPIRLAFAKTINKAQGQSLELCGLDLYTDCFSHGQ
ncbi:uncharacterized protein [Procambarus clarkii]|uniref:uncharacterized protein n=1 Tax=Procambarus clarkii TaxID=6728 RepID=UPI00374495F8